jgi:hypothetical protein
MRTTIRELQARLDLNEQGLRDLLDPGRLDGQFIDPEVLTMVCDEFIKTARNRRQSTDRCPPRAACHTPNLSESPRTSRLTTRRCARKY